MKIHWILIFLLIGCSNYNLENSKDSKPQTTVKVEKTTPCKLQKTFESYGLVNVQHLDSNIRVNLRYSTTNNFLKQDVYGCLDSAFVQNETAQKLHLAQQILTAMDSSLCLLIWDAVRPRSVQQKMWDILKMPFDQKKRFVSNPKNGSIHNYGCAVDLTISDTHGYLLDMGTDFDHFGIAASTRSEYTLLNNGTITKNQLSNRRLLRTVMRKAGFSTISSEWWHFNAMSRRNAKLKYAILE